MIHAHLEFYLKKNLRSPKSADAYLFDIDRFIRENPGYATYGYREISAWFARLNDRYRREDGRVTSSVARIFTSVKWLYTFLVHDGTRDTHPFPPGFRIRGTRKKGTDGSGILTPSELETLLMHVRTEPMRFGTLRLRNLVIVSLLVYQALTSRELVNLTVDDISLDAGTVRVRRTLSTQARTLPLHPSQYMLLHNYLTECRPKLVEVPELDRRFIAGTRGGGTVDMICRLLLRYGLVFGGKPVTAENIRKSVIYNRLNVDKQSVADVQVFAGHKLPSTTEGYVSKIDFADRDAINAVHPMEFL